MNHDAEQFFLRKKDRKTLHGSGFWLFFCRKDTKSQGFTVSGNNIFLLKQFSYQFANDLKHRFFRKSGFLNARKFFCLPAGIFSTGNRYEISHWLQIVLDFLFYS